MKIWTIAGGLAVALAALIGGLPSAAAAGAPVGWPTECHYYKSSDGSGWANCDGGTGYHRVVINCKDRDTGAVTFYSGASWKTRGQWSVRYCPQATEYLQYVGIETKASAGRTTSRTAQVNLGAAGMPTECRYQALDPQTEPEGAYAICRAGTGSYQVVVNCRSLVTGDAEFYYGKWVHKGVNSIRWCPPNSFLRFVGINLRGN